MPRNIPNLRSSAGTKCFERRGRSFFGKHMNGGEELQHLFNRLSWARGEFMRHLGISSGRTKTEFAHSGFMSIICNADAALVRSAKLADYHQKSDIRNRAKEIVKLGIQAYCTAYANARYTDRPEIDRQLLEAASQQIRPIFFEIALGTFVVQRKNGCVMELAEIARKKFDRGYTPALEMQKMAENSLLRLEDRSKSS